MFPRRPALQLPAPSLRSSIAGLSLPGLAPGLLLILCLALGAACGTGPETSSREPAGSGEPDATALRSLPYAEWVPLRAGEERQGVTRWRREATEPGLTLFSPRQQARAVLVDLAGRTRHAWTAEHLPDDGPWQHVELLPGGNLVLLIKDRLLARIDWDSRLVWALEGRFHHDAVGAGDGRLWALDRREETVPWLRGEVPVLTDRALEIDDASGEILRTVDLLPTLLGSVEARLPEIAAWFEERGGRGAVGELIADTPPDLFHTNSVVELERNVAGLGKAGDLLLSVRHLDRLVVLDPRSGEPGWVWGGRAGLDGQHHATVVGDDPAPGRGRVLLFDNGRERGWSRVLEVDPLRGEVAWSYRGEPREGFFSRSRGGAQRLAGGNTLITESDLGRLFEVTPGGEIVWEYLAPIHRPRGREGEAARAAIYRATRIEGELLGSLIEPLRRSRRRGDLGGLLSDPGRSGAWPAGGGGSRPPPGGHR